MLGGFASLPGDIDFWDRNKKKVICPTVKDINSPKYEMKRHALS